MKAHVKQSFGLIELLPATGLALIAIAYAARRPNLPSPPEPMINEVQTSAASEPEASERPELRPFQMALLNPPPEPVAPPDPPPPEPEAAEPAPAAAVSNPQPPAAPRVVWIGVRREADAVSALLYDRDADEVRRVFVGDRVGEFRVGRITDTEIELTHERGSIVAPIQ
jgi:hypothetical protein